MPIVSLSDYRSPAFLFNGHLQTILPALFRRVADVQYERERITTPDQDFLDLDWSLATPGKRARSLAILCHGLEGNSTRPYMLGMVRAFNQQGWDALAWNFRSCSEEMNHLPCFYHSGATHDLDHVVQHALTENAYERVVLVGFSLGGNLVLKYVGERGDHLPTAVERAMVFSVPCDLGASARQIARRDNYVYMSRFLSSLRQKIDNKSQQQPGKLSPTHLRDIRTLEEFDDKYTAPLHGFRSARDYYQKCSSRHYLGGIRIPTLIVNAKNDPFLSLECYPTEEAKNHPYVFLEIPNTGGHCGFCLDHLQGNYWSEQRALQFLETHVAQPAQAAWV
ncbi:hypothetical protein SAMN05421823_101296 [Catalinimonas alkaloidigena]|uniref:AB hydrolase-1 domain-containing protein n=1 Tax=Catalinimonas alkaloidigena TaxID=1075417 RepID=A0A1G8XAI6_9BACT|nr:alpha/beta fold hydrolase [Catalinimonas alkaloidigena]SDJ86865.1 hypothetical protein SAMN05421823_101296 [Catalinimonas alkaloidigena]